MLAIQTPHHVKHSRQRLSPTAALFLACGILCVGPLTTFAQEPLPQLIQGVDEDQPGPPGNNLNPLLIEPPPSVRAKESVLIEQILDPELVLRIDPTRSKVIRTKVPIHRIAITHPGVLEVSQLSPIDFEFIGRRSGETTLTMWFQNPDGRESIIRYLVRVGPDESGLRRAELEYGQLQNRINEMFPNSQVQLIPMADKLIVRGQARDSEEATQIMTVIRGHSGDGARGGYRSNPVSGGSVARLPGAADLPVASVVNLLSVPGEHQVMLKVRIAELTRSALRDLGADFDFVEGRFSFDIGNGGGSNISAIFDAGDYSLFVKAFSSNGYGKILAEPTLVTLSGHTASFISGGEFAVPTAVGVDGVSAATTSFRGFGTQLSFTPTVIDKDRIRLHVTPSFSTINSSNSVNGIPGLDTRAVATTVDLREGQWLAVAGLIQDQQGGSRGKIPYFGAVPVLGVFFGNHNVKREETELIVLVSPELVHPLEAEQVPLILPGMDVTEPTNAAFYWGHRIEGRPEMHHRSTVFPVYSREISIARAQAVRDARQAAKGNPAFKKHQKRYVCGPHGFSN
jgi:pilus assembly protein CpaC